MPKVTMIGCDLHDRWMLLKLAVDRGTPQMKRFRTGDVPGVIEWMQAVAREHGSKRIVFAYEASGRAFGLHDDLTGAGIECHVLAPTHLPRTVRSAKNKTDEKDAQMILDEVRAHVLAGRKLPAVWVPNLQTRDDREAVRMRLQLAAQRTRVKNQIRSLIKRSKLDFPSYFTGSGEWSRRSVQWLRDAAAGTGENLRKGVRISLGTLLNLYAMLTGELKTLDKEILELASTDRYARAFRKLNLMRGVGTLTAMVFLTELGDLNRFSNRRQLAAYLGLAPASFESGERNDRKGHITRQGPARVRHVLCQAAWGAVRAGPWKESFERIKRGSRKRSKIAIVAIMRQLAITMWQAARSADLDEILTEFDRQKAGRVSDGRGSAPDPGIYREDANPEAAVEVKEEGVVLC